MDNRYSLKEFVQRTAQTNKQEGLFEMEGDRMLEVHLNGTVWTRMGSMVAYLGNVTFKREGVMEHGLGKLLKKAFTGEGMMLTKAEGQGVVYLADQGKKVSILHLNGEALYVNGNDMLAFEPSIQWDIKMMKKITGIMAGGLFNVRVEGTGMVAITTHYDPVTIPCKQGYPVFTDPNATVAWSGNLYPELKTDVSIGTFFGRGSGESLQMMFNGDGFIVIQPFEEITFQQTGAR